MRSVVWGAVLAACIVLAGTEARAYGLFACVDGYGQQVCVINTGVMTDFSPSALCNSSCPACVGTCNGAKMYPASPVGGGYWVQTWQEPPGYPGQNVLNPGSSEQQTQNFMDQNLASPLPPPVVVTPQPMAPPQ